MRIVVLTGTYAPSANGVAISVAELKKSLEKRGHEVFLLAPDNRSGKEPKEKNVFRYSSVDNPIHKDYPFPLIPINNFLISTLPKKSPDIVHVHHAYHIGAFAKLIADYYQAPLVFTYHTNHDLYAKKYVGILPKFIRNTFLDNLVYDFCKKVDLVVSPAEHTTKKLIKKVKGINIVTIPSAISIKTTHINKNKLKKEKGLQGKKVLLSVGRLSVEKSPDLLIRSLKYLPEEYILVLVGDGPDRKKLKELSVKLKLDKRVKFLKKIEHKLISNFYGMADIFVFASDTETQGLVFLEAMKFGLPIVAVDSEASRELLHEGTGLISPKKPKIFAEKILELEKENWDANSKIAKKIAARYSPESIALKMEKAYLSTIKKFNDKNS